MHVDSKIDWCKKENEYNISDNVSTVKISDVIPMSTL